VIPRVTIALTQFVKPVATGKSPGGTALGVGSADSQGGQSGEHASSFDSKNKQHKDNKKDESKSAFEGEKSQDAGAEKPTQSGAGKSINLRLVKTDQDITDQERATPQAEEAAEAPDLPPIPEGQSVSHTFFQLFESIQNTRSQVAGWLGNRVYLGPGKSGAKSKGRFKKGSMLDHKAS
jgi:hypothetical protein